ncbi:MULTISPECIES: hypothetical protein [unclassified Microbacterium]|uniref:hypothetical protein n=1 Tax=unclassified Microbacterium TaxID=2609290 RepID=UPI003015E511
MSGLVAAGADSADGLDINHGGAIAVDTEQLRDVGARMRAVAAQYEEAHDSVRRAQALISVDPSAAPQLDVGALRRNGERLGALHAELEDACAGTLLMADAFEVVELRARAEALSRGDEAEAAVVRARLDQLLAGDDRLRGMADQLEYTWMLRRFQGLGDQYDAGGLLPPLFLTGAMVGVFSGRGKLRPGVPLEGRADPVTVTRVKASTPKGAPKGLAPVLGRLPVGSAQVAVEKYTMPGGATRYLAYVGGTRDGMPGRTGSSEPWDMKSNLELYGGQRSASYQATLDALSAAGAKPGERVDVVGYSQGGMIASHLAMESPFDVATTITVGSPTEPTLRDDQTLIELWHTDDVVSSLAAGGSPEGTGSADSFAATREGDPDDGPQDLVVKAHNLEVYTETAKMIDGSHDPRAEALRAYWGELGDAVAVERTEYRAERTP